jgi:hypothetical protein
MKPLNRFPYFILGFVLLSCWGCREGDGLEGRYRGILPNKNQPQAVTLELGRTGQGTWKTGGDQVPFKWKIRGTEVRLHTREGGVIIGTVGDNTIALQLPGMPSLTLKKIAR